MLLEIFRGFFSHRTNHCRLRSKCLARCATQNLGRGVAGSTEGALGCRITPPPRPIEGQPPWKGRSVIQGHPPPALGRGRPPKRHLAFYLEGFTEANGPIDLPFPHQNVQGVHYISVYGSRNISSRPESIWSLCANKRGEKAKGQTQTPTLTVFATTGHSCPICVRNGDRLRYYVKGRNEQLAAS